MATWRTRTRAQHHRPSSSWVPFPLVRWVPEHPKTPINMFSYNTSLAGDFRRKPRQCNERMEREASRIKPEAVGGRPPSGACARRRRVQIAESFEMFDASPAAERGERIDWPLVAAHTGRFLMGQLGFFDKRAQKGVNQTVVHGTMAGNGRCAFLERVAVGRATEPSRKPSWVMHDSIVIVRMSRTVKDCLRLPGYTNLALAIASRYA
jgi:hypothetical protein